MLTIEEESEIELCMIEIEKDRRQEAAFFREDEYDDYDRRDIFQGGKYVNTRTDLSELHIKQILALVRKLLRVKYDYSVKSSHMHVDVNTICYHIRHLNGCCINSHAKYVFAQVLD